MRIALAQLNPTVGDFAGNLSKLAAALDEVRPSRPDLVVFPEMFLTGYPPQDLLERRWFVERAEASLAKLLEMSKREAGTAILVGTISRSGRPTGKGLHNTAVLVGGGEILARTHKVLLPTYDVFDEARYFDPATEVRVARLGDERLGVSICEDAWTDPSLSPRPIYDSDPVAALAADGATILINISASPFHAGKDSIRYGISERHARRHGLPFVLVNQVGGNDELVFDGRSMCVSPGGGLVEYLPGFREALAVVDPRADASASFTPADPVGAVHDALVTGLSDYLVKCGFRQAVVGLSGGIDSAVVCALAAEALGPGNVLAVGMPSEYSSPESLADARALALGLGVEFTVVPISEIYAAYLSGLGGFLPGTEITVTHENIQARTRGNILMALSNATGRILLSTGNKSEIAVGYCTLYGDMSGGLAVISDVPKTMIYRLAAYLNRDREVIPAAIVEKPPSAELRPGQLDRDTLPPYEVLDPILDMYIDRGATVQEIVEAGHDENTVRWVIRAVNSNEYKRRQAAPGLKVTSKAFGTGRRMPIAARLEP
jgi:NAD+ synthase (glutamine-hydrolysing)